jgi:hypothetical protein
MCRESCFTVTFLSCNDDAINDRKLMSALIQLLELASSRADEAHIIRQHPNPSLPALPRSREAVIAWQALDREEEQGGRERERERGREEDRAGNEEQRKKRRQKDREITPTHSVWTQAPNITLPSGGSCRANDEFSEVAWAFTLSRSELAASMLKPALMMIVEVVVEGMFVEVERALRRREKLADEGVREWAEGADDEEEEGDDDVEYWE